MNLNLYNYKTKTTIVSASWIFQMQKIVFATVISLYYKLNPNSRLRHCIKSSIVALWNILSFPFLQVLTSLEPPALKFYNVVLFSIYGDDEDTRGIIINIKKYC